MKIPFQNKTKNYHDYKNQNIIFRAYVLSFKIQIGTPKNSNVHACLDPRISQNSNFNTWKTQKFKSTCMERLKNQICTFEKC